MNILLYIKMYFPKWKRVSIILLLIWLAVTYFVMAPLKCSSNNGEDVSMSQDRIDKLTMELETLKLQHSKLIAQVKKGSSEFSIQDIDGSLLMDPSLGPAVEYEELRRRIYSNTKELSYYLNHELTKGVNSENRMEKLGEILAQTVERKRSLLSDMEKLSSMDGYSAWRKTEANNVSDLIQRRLRALQNPPDCREARKLVCNLCW